ncbi:MAG TPA: Gfo/Idh/MocA family oxidoreductase [Paludibacter sp.]
MKRYNWGIIGTGYIAQKMADALPLVLQSRLYAVASRSMDTANEFAAKHNCKAYGSYEELANDPDIDIVYIATPHNYHCENTLMCISKGKHVLCEKPFAVNGWEVRLMIDAAREKGVFLMEALWTRFNPRVVKAKDIIEWGQLGKIKLFTSNLGDQKPFDPTNRFFNKELIGGSLLDLGIYPLFMALLMLGKPKTIKAFAGIGSTGIDTNCSFTLGFEDDAMAVMHSSLVAATDGTSTIYCEKGKIQFGPYVYAPEQVTIVHFNGEKEDITLPLTGNYYQYEAIEVIQCLEQGKTQSSMWSWDDSLMMIDVLDEIRKQIGLVYKGHDI